VNDHEKQPDDDLDRRDESASDRGPDTNKLPERLQSGSGIETRPVGDELSNTSAPADSSKFKTDYLNVPEREGVDISNRPPSQGTARLTSAWKLRWKVGDETYIMPAEERVVIGRAAEGDTSIGFDLTPFGAYHHGVSRMHAVLTMHDGFLYLEDLNSTNGTRINGFQMTPKQRYRLRDGDEIEFGRLRTILRFEPPGAK
jgi:hypothetical protein